MPSSPHRAWLARSASRAANADSDVVSRGSRHRQRGLVRASAVRWVAGRGDTRVDLASGVVAGQIGDGGDGMACGVVADDAGGVTVVAGPPGREHPVPDG